MPKLVSIVILYAIYTGFINSNQPLSALASNVEPPEEKHEKENITDKLLLAQVFFRHGDRSPLFTFPTNPVNVTEVWPRGLGQLTAAGEARAEELGQFFRDRYGKLLNDSYHPDEIHVWSSCTDRTTMTALSVLQGMYPTKGRFWSPVPLRTIPGDVDNILCFSAECPSYQSELYCHRKYGEGKSFDDKHAEFYKFVANHTGIPVEQIDMDKVSEIYDTLRIQSENKLGDPAWTTREHKGFERHTMRTIARYAQTSLIHNHETMILRGGPIVRLLMDNYEAYIKKMEETGEDDFEIYLYSGHDTTVSTLLHVFNAHNGALVPYTGAVMVEFYKRTISHRGDADHIPCKSETGERLTKCERRRLQKEARSRVTTKDYYYLRIFYRNCVQSPRAQPIELFMPHCNGTAEAHLEEFCDIEAFKKLKSCTLGSDWGGECTSGGCSCGSSWFGGCTGSGKEKCTGLPGSGICCSVVRFTRSILDCACWILHPITYFLPGFLCFSS